MIGAIIKLGLASAALMIPLFLWRVFYPSTDWAVLILLPLGFALFWTMQKNAVAVYRAKMDAALLTASPLSRLLTGKFSSGLLAFGFIFVAMPALSWQALSSSPVEAISIFVICLVAGATSLMSQTWLTRHLHPAFSRTAGMAFGAFIIAVVLIPALAWINWSDHKDSIQVGILTPLGAISLGMNELPSRRGWIAELLAVFYAAEFAKLWLVMKYQSTFFVVVLFSLDTALVAFIAAKVFVVLTDFVGSRSPKGKLS
jgi:hypothetical protein